MVLPSGPPVPPPCVTTTTANEFACPFCISHSVSEENPPEPLDAAPRNRYPNTEYPVTPTRLNWHRLHVMSMPWGNPPQNPEKRISSTTTFVAGRAAVPTVSIVADAAADEHKTAPDDVAPPFAGPPPFSVMPEHGMVSVVNEYEPGGM